MEYRAQFLQKLSNGYMTYKQFFLSCNRPLSCNATCCIDGILAVLKAVYVHYMTVFTIGVVLYVLLLHKEINLKFKNTTQNMNYVR